MSVRDKGQRNNMVSLVNRASGAVSLEFCMPAIFLSCHCRHLLLSPLPPSTPVPPLPPGALSFKSLAAVPPENVIHQALPWTPEKHVGQFCPSRLHPPQHLTGEVPFYRQKTMSIRDKPTYPNKKHLPSPKPYFPFK